MKKDKKQSGILGLVIVTVLAFVVVFATRMLKMNNSTSEASKNAGESIDISGYQDNAGDIQIRSASEHLAEDGSVDGYIVSVASKGFAGEILMDVVLDKTGDNITSLSIVSQTEIPNLGGKIVEDAFLSQFNNVAAPVYLPGMSVETSGTAETTETKAAPAETTAAPVALELKDGTYKAETEGFKEFGFNDIVTLTVSGGKITEVVWDAYNEAGEYKSVLSADGAFEMSKDGLSWTEQAAALTKFVMENQNTAAIVHDSSGKTDSVAGVSISVSTFINLVDQCIAQAAPEGAVKETTAAVETTAAETTAALAAPAAGTEIEAISGATISSTAVVNGINKAQTFVKEFVLAK